MSIVKITRWNNRTGNHLLTILNTIEHSFNRNNFYKLEIPEHKFFTLKSNVNLSNKEICKSDKIHDFTHNINPNIHNPLSLEQLKSIYLKYVKYNDLFTKYDISENDIGIHIRSGDIFIGNHPHGYYIQPPLNYYTEIINNNINKSIIIVFENDNNPVINKLKEIYENKQNIKFQSSSLEKDIYTLSKCKLLVWGTGTFCLIPYCLSTIIQKQIIPTTFAGSIKFFNNNKSTDTILFIDLPNYINGWKNNEEQRKTMLNYKLSNNTKFNIKNFTNDIVSKINITQIGHDGFGHQLLGMLSLISCENENVTYKPIKHHNNFEHLTSEEKNLASDFINKFLKKYFNIKDFDNNNKVNVMSRNNNNLCLDTFNYYEDRNNSILGFDNAWSTKNIGQCFKNKDFGKYLLPLLPPSNFEDKYTNIAIHLRGGDGNNRAAGISNINYINQICNIIDILNKKYNTFFHIHTNAVTLPNILVNKLKIFNHKIYININILETLSQLCNCKILLLGDSSLSILSCYMNKHDLILCPDSISVLNNRDTDCRVEKIYNNFLMFSKYINMNNIKKTIIPSKGCGFYSTCFCLLNNIINTKQWCNINGIKIFNWYKSGDLKDKDIYPEYFLKKDTFIDNFPSTLRGIDPFKHQFMNFDNIKFDLVNKITDFYFTPSINVQNIILTMENKYSINYNETLAIFFRGADKKQETKLPTYDEYLNNVNTTILNDANIKSIIIQSDEYNFIEFMKQNIKKINNNINIIVFTDEIQTLKGSEIKKYHSVDRINKSKNFHYSKHFLAITNIISKSYKIIINSGNIGFFIVLFRKNNKNVIQLGEKLNMSF